ncbi:MAG: prolyl oligopeptidase family serine peptidase [Planctomycetota bacterium]
MDDRFRQLPSALRQRSRWMRLGGVPTLLATPDSEKPAPFVVWMHGRTADKELDPGRYLRWIRAGIAAVSLDLPGHGEREGPRLHGAESTPRVLSQMIDEVDSVLGALRESPGAALLDFDRVGIGGMSAGGMVTLRRLCDEHRFACAAVESTTGWLRELYQPSVGGPSAWPASHDPKSIDRIDPRQRLDTFRPVPLLVLHSESDVTVPWPGMQAFLAALGDRYEHAGVSRDLIEVQTWP